MALQRRFWYFPGGHAPSPGRAAHPPRPPLKKCRKRLLGGPVGGGSPSPRREGAREAAGVRLEAACSSAEAPLCMKRRSALSLFPGDPPAGGRSRPSASQDSAAGRCGAKRASAADGLHHG
eukprot:13973309-Alexandrium_andersonii.AAC.1